ncbi:hypothetical protein A3731_06170 [Roseovarius sp. HI0049]|nr:hypothetical protein A3731_06170 [Roseovarius sp. HI0049]
MADRQQTPPTPLGIYDKSRRERVTGIEVIAVALSVLWLVMAAVFFLFMDPETLIGGAGGAAWFILVMLTVFMPVAMIWVAATAARSSRVMREESQRLQVAIDAMRHAYITQSQNRNAVSEPSVTKKLEEIAAAQRKTETALATFSSTRPTLALPHPPKQIEAAPPQGEDQVSLPLGTPAEDMQPPLASSDFIRALNFPETAEDKAGFAALRRALKDRPTAQLIQAAQDVLTLMSHDGIYMDDLRPDLARPEVWRRFAAGERGRSIAQLGGIRDRSSLALTAARMKSDPIFRDAVHHFLRIFDRMISAFAETASDSDLTEMSNTRTSRAFMLLGRVTGTFD